MLRRTFIMGVVAIVAVSLGMAHAADLKVIKTQKAKDISVSLLGESGQWKQGNNDFVIVFTSAKDSKPVDAGKVTLNTSMPMPGMAPMISGAAMKPDGTPGRYRGTISFPDKGDRQVTVTWAGPAGTGATKFTVPVR